MKLKEIFSPTPKAKAVQTRAKKSHPYVHWMGHLPLSTPDHQLYDAMREGIPLVDAALDKIVRLTGGFRVHCSDKTLQKALDRFVQTVPVGPTARSLRQFITIYLDSLLTYGNAVGEIVLTPDGRDIRGLYNANLRHVRLKEGDNPFQAVVCTTANGIDFQPVPYPQLVLFTPLTPPAGQLRGVSLLRSLPFVSSILMEIYQSTGNNFQRLGNLRYAVTYNPSGSAVDRVNAKEIADSMAGQWQEVMSSKELKDFVAVGDVSVKVIGADNQQLETDVPVRQMLEQIVAKLGVPPFMLGLHWSTTERMSTQQADILTSELKSYRHLLEQVIVQICETYLRLQGSGAQVAVEWDDINLQDQMEEANVRLINAQAAALEADIQGRENSQHDSSQELPEREYHPGTITENL